MNIKLIIFLCSCAVFLAACSGSDSISPDSQKATLRFYNGNTETARIVVGDEVVFDALSPGSASDQRAYTAGSDSITFSAVDAQANTSLARARTLLKPVASSIILFPATTALSCAYRPPQCVVQEDPNTPPAGRARVRVINATKDGAALSLKIDGMEVLAPSKLAVGTVSNSVDIESGEHEFTLVNGSTEQYTAAYRTVSLKAGTSYSLMLTGSISLEDKHVFTARLYTDAASSQEFVDLFIPPDVGKYQIVNAVAGLKLFEVKLDGVVRPETARIPFSESTGYIDLEIGAHTTGVFVNGTPLIQETRTTTTLRSRKTLFVTGSMVPPNLAGIEVVDLGQPLSPSNATVRFINLSPDAPALDFYRVVNGVEAIIDGSAMLEFRQMTKTANGTMQFTELPAGRITILAKKANTQTLVLQPTQITLLPGEVATLWVGGVSAAAQLYHVKHN